MTARTIGRGETLALPGGLAARGRGRPPQGQRVQIRIPDDLLAQVDQIASDAEMTRAEVIRALLAEALKVRTRRRK